MDEVTAQRMQTLKRLLPGLEAGQLVSRAPALLGSTQLEEIVPRRMAAMSSLLPGVDVLRLVRHSPALLLYHEDTLAPRIEFIKRLFPESPRLLSRAPLLLTHDPETFLMPKIHQLESLLPGIDVLKVVRTEPTILYLDIGGLVKRRLESLSELLPGHDVSVLVRKVPRLLTTNVSSLAQKIIHRRPALLVSKIETTVAAKFQQLQDLFPDANVVSMVESDATVLLYDYTSVGVKVDCWRERVSNATELNQLIQDYPLLLSYSLDTSVSRLDFLIETTGVKPRPATMRTTVRMAKRDWLAVHGAKYRKFLERKVEGPSVLRLWPGLYFDSDTGSGNGSGGRLLKGEGMSAKLQDDGSVEVSSAAEMKEASAYIKSLERKYGKIIKETQLRFTPAVRRGKLGDNPSEVDMILYDIKSFDQQVRKLATGYRLKRFKELLPGLDTETLFTEYPNVLLMDLKKVEDKVEELRELLPGERVAGVVSVAPDLLLNDVQTCLRPRMTRLVAALTTVKQFQGVLDADKVRAMVVTCPQLLLSDVRNVVVPSLQYMLQSTSDHDELATRLFRDPSLLVVGVGPLARLQYTLEQHRHGTASIAMGNLGAYVGPEAALTASHHPTPWVGSGSGKAATGGTKRTRSPSKKNDASSDVYLREDQSRLLPPVIVPQVLKCQMRDFITRNPEYVSFLAQRQGLDVSSISHSPEGDDQSVAFWERAVGGRLSEMFRPVDSPYAREMREARVNGKGPDGQKAPPLSELDMLVGDVLHFNDRMTVLASKIQKKMPQTVDVGEEANKLAEDVRWGSRQIKRLLGLGSWTEQGVATPHSEVQVAEIPSQNANDAPENVCDPVSTFPQGKQRGKKRQWVSDTFQSFMGSVGGSAAGGVDAVKVATAVEVSVKDGGNRETAQELERLLGEVSSNEGRLDNLLDLSSSIPGNTDDWSPPAEDGGGVSETTGTAIDGSSAETQW
ncbi:expressed unknown protein [Ectocarpus siliculosus]|uniref:Uncharacterized protein n=1 Tax=Ectocarpus siliculosus TaxID=2880 RepID=D7FSD0_ECTSI|nr:expressed unknown protein [Ectocarpus siliculosus]|eukprot:CBJ31071.1 expressed unknown protein [Ectocarpus siliculosus]